jgi:hypothetical protein
MFCDPGAEGLMLSCTLPENFKVKAYAIDASLIGTPGKIRVCGPQCQDKMWRPAIGTHGESPVIWNRFVIHWEPIFIWIIGVEGDRIQMQ